MEHEAVPGVPVGQVFASLYALEAHEARRAAEAERDQLRHDYDAIAAVAQRALRRSADLEAALQRYGRHGYECEQAMTYSIPDERVCSCGLSAALGEVTE